MSEKLFSKKFILNIRSNNMTYNAVSQTFSTTINFPELNGYSKYKLAIRDFIIHRNNSLGDDTTYLLCCNKIFSNMYDTRGTNNVIASVPYAFPVISMKGYELEMSGNINGNLELWLEDLNGVKFTKNNINDNNENNNYLNFYLSLVIEGEN